MLKLAGESWIRNKVLESQRMSPQESGRIPTQKLETVWQAKFEWGTHIT